VTSESKGQRAFIDQGEISVLEICRFSNMLSMIHIFATTHTSTLLGLPSSQIPAHIPIRCSVSNFIIAGPSSNSGDSMAWLRRANQVLVGVGLSVCTSCLMMRIYTKTVIMRSFWWDDGKSAPLIDTPAASDG
jgi:hypothetical protein